MDPSDLDRLADRFAALSRRYGPVFRSWGGWTRGEQYLRGLLVGGDDRRNAENLAVPDPGSTARLCGRPAERRCQSCPGSSPTPAPGRDTHRPAIEAGEAGA